MTPSASGLGRAFACPGAYAYPYIDKQSSAAKRGTQIHTYLEDTCLGLPQETALTKLPPYLQKLCKKIDFDWAIDGIGEIKPEVSFSWNHASQSARIVGERLGRNYDIGDTEIAGTADVYGMGEVGPVVLDWKTGMSVGPVRDNWQMRFLALTAARVSGFDRCEARIVYIGRYGETTSESHVFTDIDFDGDALAIKDVVEDIRQAQALVQLGKRPTLVTGPQCKYCPAQDACPAYKERNVDDLLSTSQTAA